MVSMELFNRGEDYLFEGVDAGEASPLVECLDAGWRVGFYGVTDEHNTNWGEPDGKGRTGLYVTELTRPGVRTAMEGRSAFATREKGLRVDAAAASGQPRRFRDLLAGGARMGTPLRHSSGPVTFALDIDRGSSWVGKPLLVQVLQTGRPLPTIIAEVPIRVPAPNRAVTTFSVPVNHSNGTWVVLRVTDPSQPADTRAPGRWQRAGRAVAYPSPVFLS